MAQYRPAAICRRGHVISSGIDDLDVEDDLAKHCPDCGAPVMTGCERCNYRLQVVRSASAW